MRETTLKSMGLRPVGHMAKHRFRHTYAWIDGHMIDITPGPGRYYTKDTWPPRGRGRGESLLSPRRIEARQRAHQALALWRAGYTWQAIARMLGYADKSGAWRAVRRLYDRHHFDEQRKEEARQLRTLCHNFAQRLLEGV